MKSYKKKNLVHLGACNNTKIPKQKDIFKPPRFETNLKKFASCEFFVDAINGKDSNSGTMSQPFQTIQKGLFPILQLVFFNFKRFLICVFEN